MSSSSSVRPAVGGAGSAAPASVAAAGAGARAHTVASLFDLGRTGDWETVRSALHSKDAPAALPGQCARFVDPSSKRTLLHLAAETGHEKAARMFVRYGAKLAARDEQGHSPAEVAELKGFTALKDLLEKWGPLKSVWAPVEDPLLWASSNKWLDAQPKKVAKRAFSVAYAGGQVDIPEGGSYYPDSAGRPLVGWSGSYDPPRDMDGDSVFDP